MSNMGVECEGFGADTLHMARLLDASRTGKRTYGLDNLSADWKVGLYVLSFCMQGCFLCLDAKIDKCHISKIPEDVLTSVTSNWFIRLIGSSYPSKSSSVSLSEFCTVDDRASLSFSDHGVYY